MTTIDKIESEIINDFSLFDDWDGKYEYIIEFGKNLPPMDSRFKTEENKVSGCQSQVWLHSEYKDGKVYFYADSDAIITKGLVGLLLKVLSGRTPKEIINAKLEFIEKIGMNQHLSMNRANGLASMVKHMKKTAEKYINNTSIN